MKEFSPPSFSECFYKFETSKKDMKKKNKKTKKEKCCVTLETSPNYLTLLSLSLSLSLSHIHTHSLTHSRTHTLSFSPFIMYLHYVSWLPIVFFLQKPFFIQLCKGNLMCLFSRRKKFFDELVAFQR